MRNIEQILLGKIYDLAYTLARDAEEAEFDVADAEENLYQLEGDLPYLENDEVTDHFDDNIADACQNLKDAKKSIAKMDKTIAKILALRLKLADETEIPFNVSGGRQWVRVPSELL